MSAACQQPEEDAEVEDRGDDEHDEEDWLARLVVEVRATRPTAEEAPNQREQVQHDLWHA